MPCGVYFIRSPSGKMYIGSSEKIGRRVSKHFCMLGAGKHPSNRLTAAYRKYGGAGFTHGVLEVCAPDKLAEREQYWIDALKPRYNSRLRATSNFGIRLTSEERRRHSKAMKALVATDADFRQHLFEQNNANWADPEARARRIASMKAAWTPEKRRALSERQRGVDKGGAARAVRWSREGASERASAIQKSLWDKRGRVVTFEAIAAKVAESGWKLLGVEVGRVNIHCAKHDHVGAPTARKLLYAGQGCRFCGFERSSIKQLGRPKKKGGA